ncbi:hypothetical protein FZC66_14485 [Priestia megaterium]|nr:hypothetical protein FZC66_14485 [Priestia megaterium]
MKCFCENGKTATLKVEGDVGADPIWCSECGCNYEVENFCLSTELQEQLTEWAGDYGAWFDWETDTLIENGIEMEQLHNKRGKALTEQLEKELGITYRVRFSPASTARAYN